jgi:hypothetical protein
LLLLLLFFISSLLFGANSKKRKAKLFCRKFECSPQLTPQLKPPQTIFYGDAMGFATAGSVAKESEDVNVYSSYVANFLSNASWNVHSFEQKSSSEKLKAELNFLFSFSHVARRHKMREVPQHKFYVWLLDIIRRDRSGSEQPLDDMNCIRQAVNIMRDLFDVAPNIIWNSRKKELTTNIHAWTPLDSEERRANDSMNASLMSPRDKTFNLGGSVGASRGIGGFRDTEERETLKNATFFVSTHHRNTGPREDWKSFVSLIEESMYTPEQIEKMNRSSRAATALRKSRRGDEKEKDKEQNEKEEEEEEAKTTCSYDQCFGSTLLLGHVAYVLEYDLTVRKAYAITERKKNTRKALENVFDIFKHSLVYRLFSIEADQTDVLRKLAHAVMRGCVEDEDSLEKLIGGGAKKTTPEELARFKRIDASTKELSKSAASIMNTLLSSVWDLKEANIALSKFALSQQRESSASLSPLGASVTARKSVFDRMEDNVFDAIKDVVLVEANKNKYGGYKFAANYLRSLGSDEVKLEMFRRCMMEKVDTSRIGTNIARDKFPAFSKDDKVELVDELGTLLCENYKETRGAVKDKLFNLVNLVSSSSKVLLENNDDSRKKQKLVAAHVELEKQISMGSTTSKEAESRANFVSSVVLGL